MICAICLYDGSQRPRRADTVINGYAVCEAHFELAAAADQRFADLVKTAHAASSAAPTDG
jgi:hypothetical protein